MSTAMRVDRGTLRKYLVVGAVTALLVVTAVIPAQAADGFSIDIPIIKGVTAPEGSLTPIGPVVQVPEENLGEKCLVTAHTQNQNSVHPGNDMIVESGSTQGVISDVESAPGISIDAEGTLVLGPTIEVFLRMGPDEAFSAGVIIEVDCTVFRFGQIIVKKVVNGDDDSGQTFDFTASYSDTGFSLADGEENNSGDIRPGTYAVAENVPESWTLESAVCDDGSDPEAIDLQAYETVTCTFTNNPPPPDQVEAAIVVDIDSVCTVTDGNEQGALVVSVSVDDGATVTVRDSDGDVVATVTEDATITAEPGATYTWQATPAEGFEFPAGSPTSGTVTVDNCVASLPFTGSNTGALGALAFALVAGGAITILSTKRHSTTQDT